MALREIDARTRTTAARPAAPRARGAGPHAPAALAHRPATITELRPLSRGEALAAARRERRRWLVLSALVFVTPFACCVGVLEVVR